MNAPIVVRLEVDHMKEAMQIAISERVAKMDIDIQAAVARVCTAENVLCVIESAVAKEMEASIRKEIEAFYRYGDGRKAIQEIVNRTLTGEKETGGEGGGAL